MATVADLGLAHRAHRPGCGSPTDSALERSVRRSRAGLDLAPRDVDGMAAESAIRRAWAHAVASSAEQRARLREVDAAAERRHRGEQLRAVGRDREPRVEHRDDAAIGRACGSAGRHPARARARRPAGRPSRTRSSTVAARARARRAACNGSSGAGNGMRSITTSTHATPAASMPAQNERVPTSTDVSSSMNAAREPARRRVRPGRGCRGRCARAAGRRSA